MANTSNADYRWKDYPPSVRGLLSRLSNARDELGGLLDDLANPPGNRDAEVYKLTVKVGIEGRTNTLVIVHALLGDGEPVVGFTTDMYCLIALAKALRALRDGTTKWKSDRFYRGPGEAGTLGEAGAETNEG